MLLGIDIGGTTINLGLAEGKEIVKKLTVPSFRQGADLEETLVHLENAIRQIITPEVTKIGIGVPTLVDAEKGIVYDATNIPSWKEVPLKARLEKTFGIPVALNNDANCFVMGAAARLGKPAQVVVGITLGTGTGIGVIIDGKIFNGVNCGAGELCSLPYEGGILENFCSKQFFCSKGLDPKEVGDKAFAGDPEALKLMDEFGVHLGRLLALVVLAYDPSDIVYGGGVAHSFPLFKASALRTLTELYPYPRIIDKLNISAMPEGDIPVLGASLL